MEPYINSLSVLFGFFLCSFSALIKMPNERLKSIFTLFRGTNYKANEILFFLSSKFIAGNNKSMRIYMAFCQRNQGFESIYWKIYAYLFRCLRSCGKSIFFLSEMREKYPESPMTLLLKPECHQKVKTLLRLSHAFSSLTYLRGWRYEKNEGIMPSNSRASHYPCMGQCDSRLSVSVCPLR